LERNLSLYLDYITYTSDKNQIQFLYPLSWNLEETPCTDDNPRTYIDITNNDESSGISVIYGNKLMSCFGSSIFRTALYECFHRFVGYNRHRWIGKYNQVKVIVEPSPVTIGGQDSAGSFVVKAKKNGNNPKPKIVQIWFVYVGAKTYEVGVIGDRGYEIVFYSDSFYEPMNIDIRDQLINSIRFS